MKLAASLVALVVLVLGVAGAQVDLSAATSALDSGTAEVKKTAIAIALLLSALLAIAIVVMLYLRAGGGK